MLIDSQPDLEVVAEAGDGAAAITVLSEIQADVVLMDVRMPVLDGIAATATLTAQQPELKIIVLTTFDLDEYVLAAIKAGASGFLLKNVPPEELLSAIRTVYSGDAVIAPSATKRLLSHLIAGSAPLDAEPGKPGMGVPAAATAPVAPPTPQQNPDAAKTIATLTAREREVLELMARGRSNQEIAADLFVSEATVKTHVSRVLAKLNARDRVQAVVFAYENGIAGG